FIVTITVGIQVRPAAAPQDGVWTSDYRIVNNPSFTEAISAVSTLIFAYAGTPAFFPIVSEMRDPRYYARALLVCQASVTAIYIAIGCVVYYYCGSYVASPALGSAGATVKKVCYGFALPGLIVTTTLVIHVAGKYIFVRILRGSKHLTSSSFIHWGTWLSCTFAIAISAYVIASAIPVFGGLVSLVGALLGTLMAFQPMGYSSSDGLFEQVRVETYASSNSQKRRQSALNLRLPRELPPQQMVDALDEICTKCKDRKVQILVDAESQHFQRGIHRITLDLMRKYNRDEYALVYNTYQAYLKSTPDTLAQHLAAASKEEFTLGLKLVRGAYIASDERSLIHDTKKDTDEAYDRIAQGALRQDMGEFGVKDGFRFPPVNLFLASHNKASLLAAHQLRRQRVEAKLPTVPVAFGQLQGMSDEVSFSLLQLKGPDVIRRCINAQHGAHWESAWHICFDAQLRIAMLCREREMSIEP
ncbi:hypothetical protein IFM53868_09977, partial [Aspergillus udagawae]